MVLGAACCLPVHHATSEGVLLLQGMHDSAWQACPSVLATKVALMEQLGLVESAAAMLSTALQHWQAGRQRGLHSYCLCLNTWLRAVGQAASCVSVLACGSCG